MPTDKPRRGVFGFLRGKGSRKWRIGTLAVAVAAALAIPAVIANAQDASTQAVTFKVPFPCGQTWSGQTRTNHSPADSIDFNRANDENDTVSASAPGTVSKVGNTGGSSYGRYVYIDHGGGWQTRYAHLNSQSVKVGSKVGYGTKIGTVGSTGGSTGPHLHYEQRLNGTDVKIKFDGVKAKYWGTKDYKSTNKCGGNPYSASQVCGKGYKQVDSARLTSGGKTVGTVYLMYNSSNGYNCVATLKAVSLGKATSTSAYLEVKGAKRTTDSGNFAYYGGPVKKAAPGKCVKWGGSVGSAKYGSAFEHCG